MEQGGLWIGTHFRNESLDLVTEQSLSAELLPLCSTHSSSFFIHSELFFLVAVDSCAGLPVIYVLLCKDKGSTELERWKATPCTYTEVCNAADPHGPHYSATSPVLQKVLLHISSVHHLKSRSINESLDRGSQNLKEDKVSEVVESVMGQWAWPSWVWHKCFGPILGMKGEGNILSSWSKVCFSVTAILLQRISLQNKGFKFFWQWQRLDIISHLLPLLWKCPHSYKSQNFALTCRHQHVHPNTAGKSPDAVMRKHNNSCLLCLLSVRLKDVCLSYLEG